MSLTKINFNQIKGAFVNVLDKGADPTGNTDSYAAIMAAIAEVGESGIVYFPRGIYAVSNTITIQDTNPYPAGSASGNHFITLLGDGMEATWIVHTGTQTTGCVNIIGNANWFPTISRYICVNNGTSQCRDIALGSNYGPALKTQFANKMRHDRVNLYSAATASYSLHVASCIESYFDAVQAGGGNNAIPIVQFAKVQSLLPLGAYTIPKHNYYIECLDYNDGVHGAGIVSCIELFFDRCRDDSQSTLNSLDIRGNINGALVGARTTDQISFTNCKFSGPTTQTEYCVNINGAQDVFFLQCNMEALNFSGQTAGSIRVTSGLGPADVRVEQCTGHGGGYVDIGNLAGGDAYPIDFTMTNSNFYKARMSPTARDGGFIKRLVMEDNGFYEDLDAQWEPVFITPSSALIAAYSVISNFFAYGTNPTLPCSHQASNLTKNAVLTSRGTWYFSPDAAGVGCSMVFTGIAPDVSWKTGSINSLSGYQVRAGTINGVELLGGATSWSSISDERLKVILEPISNAVDKLSTLRSVIGRMTCDPEDKRRSFLIAQDVQKVLPEAVNITHIEIGDPTEYLSLNYTDVIPLLVSAINELSSEVVALKAKSP